MKAIRQGMASFGMGAMFLVSQALAERPNVIVVMTDDQGYGELSTHGNPALRTPNLDRLHGESVRFTDFHVAPMCTPTRGQLMTGLDAFRNGAVNVSSGRTLLRREVPTMPQLFREAGYATGIFGKWHLGDAYPYRPEDRGFAEALWFPSSHIGAVPDYWENDYFDDTYHRNGRRQVYHGYTTDVFFSEALAWMRSRAEAGQPFFCYIPTAAPHWPHFVPERYREAARRDFEKAEAALPTLEPGRREQLIRYLAMIANIDENMDRLEAFLRDMKLRENTILVFLTDNGSTFGPDYYNAGMRGSKTTLWEGGHRVPCFVRWPAGRLREPGDVPGLTQVQDLLPTLLDLCAISPAAEPTFDGISLAPVLRGESGPPEDRILVINYSRMPQFKVTYTEENPSIPQREGAGVLWRRWRLLEDRELYDLSSDPRQERDVAALHPEIVARMRAHLDRWWEAVKPICRAVQPSVIGSSAQNPVLLTACEWLDVFVDQQMQIRRGTRKNGVWHLEVAQPGAYTLELRRFPPESGLRLTDEVPEITVTDGTFPGGPAFPIVEARVEIEGKRYERSCAPSDESATFSIDLEAGPTTLQTWFLDREGAEICGAHYVVVRRMK